MDKRQGFIEAFEDDQAVIFQADRSTFRVDRSSLPLEAEKGQFVVELDNSGRFDIDHVITQKRVQLIRWMCDGFCD